MNRRKALLYRSNAIRSLIKLLRKKRANYKAINEGASIDIASILIGVLVLGLIGAVIATTVFAIVPWAQDEAAKNQLKSVMAAQQAYAGIAATEQLSGEQVGALSNAKRFTNPIATGTENGQFYGDLTDLIETNFFDPAFLPVDAADEIYGEQMLSPDKNLCIIKLERGKGYEAAIRSQSGHVFITNDGWIGPIQVADTEPVCRGRVLGEYSDWEDKVVNNPQPEPTPSSTQTPYNPPAGGEHEDGEVLGDEIVAPTAAPTSPSPSPTPTPTVTSSPVATPSPSPTQTTIPTSAPIEPPKTEVIPDIPEANKNSNTKKFMFCHMGAMHSNSFNGMVNGHQGHSADIMPPIPFKNYAGWNWNAQTAKVYYNNCQPV